MLGKMSDPLYSRNSLSLIDAGFGAWVRMRRLNWPFSYVVMGIWLWKGRSAVWRILSS